MPHIQHTVQWMARRTTKWNDECEKRLKRLVAYCFGHADDVLLLVGVRGDKVKIVELRAC